MLPGGIDLFNTDTAGAQNVGEGCLCHLSLFDGYRLGILADALIGTVLREQFLYRVGSGQKVSGQNQAVFISGNGRTAQCVSIYVGNSELPAFYASIATHGLANFQFAVVDVAEGDACHLIGCNRNRLYGGIIIPVAILSGLLPCEIGSGKQIRYDHCAICSGDERRTGNSIGTVSISKQVDFPTA